MNRRNFLKGIFSAVAVAAVVPISLVQPEVLIAPTTSFVTFDQMVATTLASYHEVMVQHFTKQTVIWKHLSAKGLVS
jgi:hypothetical protein